MNGWQKLKGWREFQGVEDIPRDPGVYAVRSTQRGKPKVIGRAFGKDKSGILCFGTTRKRTLKKRLRELWRAACGEQASHAEGKTYHRLRYNENGYPLYSLEIVWLKLKTAEQARQQEIAWFRAYERIFGELPPLNKQCG